MDGNELFKVVINHKEQYSIWPANRENPLGWRDGGKEGTKRACLDYIKTLWNNTSFKLEKKNEGAG